MATELASAYLTLIPSLKGAQKQIESQLSGIDVSKSGKSMGSSLVSGFGGAFKTVAKVGVGAIAAIGTAVGGLAIGGGISRALKLDQATFKFKALGMDVKSSLDSANEAVRGTAFGLDAAATVATQLGAAGVASGDAMTGALKSIAGVAAMSGSSMEDIGAIFSKVAAKGKVGGDELLQLTERGINATAALGKYLGKSADEVSKMVSRGEIDFATFSAAMEATFGEAASGANATFQGAMSNVMAALSRVGAKFASPALEGLRKVFVATIPAIDAVSEALDPVVESFTRVANAISDHAVAGLNMFTEALEETGSFALAFSYGLQNAFKGTRLEGFFESLADSVGTFFETIRDGGSKIDAFKNALGYFGENSPAMAGINKMCRAFNIFKGELKQGTGISQSLGRAITRAFNGAPVNAFSQKIKGFFKLLEMGVSPVVAIRDQMLALSRYVEKTFDGTKIGDFAWMLNSCFASGEDALSSFRQAFWALFDGTKLQFVADALMSPFMSFQDRLGIAFDGIAATVSEKMEAVGEAIYSKLPQPLQTAIDQIGGFVSSILETLSNWSVQVGLSVGSAALILARFSGPIGAFVGAVMGAVGSVGSAIAGIGSHLAGLGSAFMTAGGGLSGLSTLLGAFASPVGIAVGAIAILGGAFVALMATNEEFRNNVMDIAGQIGASLAPIIGIVATALSDLAANVLPVIGNMIQMLLPVIGQIITVVLQIVAALAPVITMLMAVLIPIITEIITLVVEIVSQIMALVLPIITQILTLIQTAMPVIQAIITAVMIAVLAIIQAVWPLIQSIIETVMNIIQDVINIVTAAINGDWEGVWTGIQQLFSDVWAGIQGILDTAIGIVQGAIDGALSFIDGVWSDAWNNIQSFFGEIWTGIEQAASDGIDSVVETVTGIKDSIVGFFSDAGQWLWDAGSSIVQGLADGISGAVSAATGAIEGVLASVRNFLPFSPAKVGPFSGKGWTLYSGRSIVDALGEGALQRANAAASSIGRVMEKVAKPLEFDVKPVPYDWATTTKMAYAAGVEIEGGGVAPNYYTFGDITIDASSLKDIETAADFADMLVKEGRRS